MTIYSLDILLSRLEQSVVPRPVLTVASWPAYRFLGRQVRWSGIPISFKNFSLFVTTNLEQIWNLEQIYTVKGFGTINKAEIDVFLVLSFFFDDRVDVGSLKSGSSALYKTSLNIWKFSVHVLLKPSLKDFKHNLAGMWNECSCMVIWTFFGIGMKIDLFQSCGHCCFPNLLAQWMQRLTASSFKIWNSWSGILSPPLGLLVVMLPKAHLTWHSRISGGQRLPDGGSTPRWTVTPGEWIGSRAANGCHKTRVLSIPGRHQLQPSPDPLPSHSSRVFALTPGHTLADTRWSVKI